MSSENNTKSTPEKVSVEGHQLTLAMGILKYIEKYGPVDMREIIECGIATGFITEGTDPQYIVREVHKRIEAGEIVPTSQHRYRLSTSKDLPTYTT